MDTPTILIADDESALRALLGSVLSSKGFHVIESVDGLDALEKLRERGTPVDLLITDIRMPRMDGIALAEAVCDVHPSTPVIFISGYPFEIDEHRIGEPRTPCAFVQKPFTPRTLLSAVEKCLNPAPRSMASTA